MHVEDGKIVFGREECINCRGKGQVPDRIMCPNDGRTTRGKFPGGVCPECGTRRKHEHRLIRTGEIVTCRGCDGAGTTPENRFSFMPPGMMADIVKAAPLTVVSGPRRGITMNESLLGLGLIGGITDYVDWTCKDPVTLLLKVRGELVKDRAVQACKVFDEQGRLCRAIGIFPHTSGYSVRPIFGEADKLAPYAEIGEEAGILRGAAIAAAGGNGTLAIYKGGGHGTPGNTRGG